MNSESQGSQYMAPGKGTGLYVHVPFCLRKCLYCDFNSYALSEGGVEAYLQAIQMELARYTESKFTEPGLKTVFVGGGTPTVLTADSLERLLQQVGEFTATGAVHRHLAEVTVEANPGTVTPAKLDAMYRAGVNRLSIGVQSLDADMLQALGRAHNAEDALQAFTLARKAGFRNISVDLMYALPGQTMRQWQDTVERAVDLAPEHISCYSLIIEEGTPYGDWHAAGRLHLPDEDQEAAMYEWVINRLRTAGYEHYEISNFALPGFRCAHNQIYWRNEWYLGVGPGAHSHWAGERFANERNTAKYAKSLQSGRLPVVEREQLCADEQMDETLLMGLRLLEGVSEERFGARFGSRMIDVYAKQIERLVSCDLLYYDGDNLRLTERGLFVGNQVFAEFLR